MDCYCLEYECIHTEEYDVSLLQWDETRPHLLEEEAGNNMSWVAKGLRPGRSSIVVHPEE